MAAAPPCEDKAKSQASATLNLSWPSTSHSQNLKSKKRPRESLRLVKQPPMSLLVRKVLSKPNFQSWWFTKIWFVITRHSFPRHLMAISRRVLVRRWPWTCISRALDCLSTGYTIKLSLEPTASDLTWAAWLIYGFLLIEIRGFFLVPKLQN